jgi:peptidoglycan/LPS O-acetylase OafA/YrhL
MRKAELPALTGIRFYAALAVFLSHVTVIPGMGAMAGQRLFFNAGVVGVSFFFVLSGFILTYNYGDVFRGGVAAGDYKRFVWDRLTKIYPVHLAALLFMVPLQVMSPNLPLDWRAVPFHLTMTQCFWPLSEPTFHKYLNVPSWSISCEWFFYLLAPLAMFFALGGSRRWVLVVATGLYVAVIGLVLSQGDYSAYSRLYHVSWFAPSRFIEFLAGVFLARAFMAAPGRLSAQGSVLAQIAGAGLLVAGALAREHAPWPLHGGLLYVPGSALLILGLAYGRGLLASHLSRPWLNRLGLASFALYLIHIPILRTVKGACMHFGWEVHSWTVFWVVAAVMFVLIQSAAFLVQYGYELPVQRHLRKLIPRKSTSSVHQQPEASAAETREKSPCYLS